MANHIILSAVDNTIFDIATLLHVCLFSCSMMYHSRHHNLSGKSIKQKPYFIGIRSLRITKLFYCFLQKVVR